LNPAAAAFAAHAERHSVQFRLNTTIERLMQTPVESPVDLLSGRKPEIDTAELAMTRYDHRFG
jgi:hypothetical protein